MRVVIEHHIRGHIIVGHIICMLTNILSWFFLFRANRLHICIHCFFVSRQMSEESWIVKLGVGVEEFWTS